MLFVTPLDFGWSLSLGPSPPTRGTFSLIVGAYGFRLRFSTQAQILLKQTKSLPFVTLGKQFKREPEYLPFAFAYVNR